VRAAAHRPALARLARRTRDCVSGAFRGHSVPDGATTPGQELYCSGTVFGGEAAVRGGFTVRS
jgi:hypothetical protein